MALVTKKKGGPYSVKERKLRREKVAELYIERGFNGLKISRILNVNRNTITNDLNFCFSQLRSEYFDFDATGICIAQFHRMEIQRARLVEQLSKDIEFKDRLRIENAKKEYGDNSDKSISEPEIISNKINELSKDFKELKKKVINLENLVNEKISSDKSSK